MFPEAGTDRGPGDRDRQEQIGNSSHRVQQGISSIIFSVMVILYTYPLMHE